MRSTGGKKKSRAAKGSKKDARPNGKRGAKSGRGGSKVGGGTGRPVNIESGAKKSKMSGRRKGDLAGQDLRFVPVIFVKAVDDFELTLETKPSDEDSEELEPIEGTTGATPAADAFSEDNGTEASVLRDVPEPSMTGNSLADASEDVSDETTANASSIISEQSPVLQLDTSPLVLLSNETQDSGEDLEDRNTLRILSQNSESQNESSDSDFEQIDARLQAQFSETGETHVVLQQHHEAPNGGHKERRFGLPQEAETPSFDESVSRLAIDSSSDSDQSPFEYDQYNASQVDESVFEPLSDSDGVTYDDYDFSDMRAGLHSEDEDDNMDELDDDQIFALASMATRRVNEYEDFDDSGFDKYDEFDEYFDQLLDRSTEVPPSTKQRASEGRRLKREARELLRSMDFGKSPVLWQKYPEEIGVREVLEEIRHFAAQRDFQSLSFPPLDNNANWYVKQFAKEHGLRPSVEGHNSVKHVICHLTGRATPHSGKGVNKLLNRRKFFRRVDKNPVGGKLKERTPSAKVRDGHVVGQHASEITNENFGHRLMRQMGWCEGSGLGKGRAGIVAPIPATVKLTKTGLGA